MTSSPTPAVLPDARAREVLRKHGVDPHRIMHTFDDVACYLAPNQVIPAMLEYAKDATPPAPITEGVTCITKPLTDAERRAGIDQWTTPPVSDAAVPAGELERACEQSWDATHTVLWRHASEQRRAEWAVGIRAALAAAAPKVASETGAGETVNVAADAILADVRGRRLLKALFREDANTNTAPVGWIDGPIDLETQRECATAWARLALAAAPKMAIGIEASRIERVAQAIYKASGSLIDQNGFIPWADLDGTTDADSYRRMATAAIATLRASDTGAGLREALTHVAQWCESIGGLDMSEIVADGGITAGMVVSQEAAEQARRARKALATPTDATDGATGGGEVQQGGKLGWDADGMCDDHYRFACKECALPATTPGGDLLEQAVTHLVNVLAADGGPRGDAAFKAARDWWTAYDRRALKPAGDGGEA